MTWPPVTVTILSYNRRAALRVTLERLFGELDYPSDRLEVIVLDNASDDGSSEMVERDFPDAWLIRSAENVGIPLLNQGFRAGRGDYFLVLDDDCSVTGDFLKVAVERSQAHDAQLTSVRVVSGVDESYVFNDEYNPGLLSYWGCSALVTRRAIDELGGYDPNLFIWANEADFAIRLLDRGMKHLFVPQLRSVHMKGPTVVTTAALEINVRHFSYIVAKHLTAGDATVAFTHILTRALLETVRRPSRVVALRAAFQGLRRGLRVRHPVRPAVSTLYRHNFVEFVSPLRFVWSPLQQWGARHDPDRGLAELRSRQQKFWADRPALFPDAEAALRV